MLTAVENPDIIVFVPGTYIAFREPIEALCTICDGYTRIRKFKGGLCVTSMEIGVFLFEGLSISDKQNGLDPFHCTRSLFPELYAAAL
jgi:hypothetical protein